MPGGGGGQSQVTIPIFRREPAVSEFWSNAILCRLAFKGLCSGAEGSDNVQFVNNRLRSRQKMPLLQRSKARLLSVNKILVFRLSNVSIVHCRFVVFQECSFAEHWPLFFKQFYSFPFPGLPYLHVAYGVLVYLIRGPFQTSCYCRAELN